jgi:hypothetical protein
MCNGCVVLCTTGSSSGTNCKARKVYVSVVAPTCHGRPLFQQPVQSSCSVQHCAHVSCIAARHYSFLLFSMTNKPFGAVVFTCRGHVAGPKVAPTVCGSSCQMLGAIVCHVHMMLGSTQTSSNDLLKSAWLLFLLASTFPSTWMSQMVEKP